jgi:light-regulated signal transduction histidine kinase (bacteriophytochrome)
MNNIQRSSEFRIQQAGASVTIEKLHDCLGDFDQVNQVFANLLDNALKFLDKERNGKITITGHLDNNESIYCVQDNGIGIDPKHQKKIFELFHRLNHDTIEGEGIGLTAVWRMLNRQEGRIWVESEPGKGSRFCVALPNA